MMPSDTQSAHERYSTPGRCLCVDKQHTARKRHPKAAEGSAQKMWTGRCCTRRMASRADGPSRPSVRNALALARAGAGHATRAPPPALPPLARALSPARRTPAPRARARMNAHPPTTKCIENDRPLLSRHARMRDAHAPNHPSP